LISYDRRYCGSIFAATPRDFELAAARRAINRRASMRRLIAALVLCLVNIGEECIASVYALGDSSQHGTTTASGIPLDDNAMTAAHKTLPLVPR